LDAQNFSSKCCQKLSCFKVKHHSY